MREQALDVAGQEIMTADKVTLRMNALVTYRITDARKAVMVTDGAKQSLYREAQLALRAVVGTRDLDSFLTDKDAVAGEFEEQVRQRAGDLGLEVVSVGVRDVILPGDMKDLMNKVTEAKKAAEANLIARREETAAMRSQANTAKLLADNPTLMRLRELEVLEKVATDRQPERRARRKGPGRPGCQPVVVPNAPGSRNRIRGFFPFAANTVYSRPPLDTVAVDQGESASACRAEVVTALARQECWWGQKRRAGNLHSNVSVDEAVALCEPPVQGKLCITANNHRMQTRRAFWCHQQRYNGL